MHAILLSIGLTDRCCVYVACDDKCYTMFATRVSTTAVFADRVSTTETDIITMGGSFSGDLLSCFRYVWDFQISLFHQEGNVLLFFA